MPRGAPMTLWADPMTIDWSGQERAELAASAKHRRLVDELPPGAHGRPEGAGESTSVLGVWTYDAEPIEPTFPPAFDPAHQEVVAAGHGPHDSRDGAVPGPYAALLRGRRLLHQDTRRTAFSRVRCPSRRIRHRRALGYGMMASNGAADLLAATRRAPPAPLRAGLPARPLRQPGLREAPRKLGRLRQL